MTDCFGKQIYKTLARRVNEAPEGATVWFAPHEARFANDSGAVSRMRNKVTGEEFTVFEGCTYPKCNCDEIKRWYAKDYQE